MRDAINSRVRPQTFARGQACFVPATRGCLWDLRGPVIMPLNFTACPASPLNVAFITTSLPEWLDARMLSYLTHGIRFEVDLPLQIVRFPHLISFPNGFASLQKEVRRMQSWGRFDIFSHLPHLPIRMICHGAKPRVSLNLIAGAQPPKPVRLANASSDESGDPVPSINDDGCHTRWNKSLRLVTLPMTSPCSTMRRTSPT
eukprot:3063023-Pleurochrysis_carterae.AAC.2